MSNWEFTFTGSWPATTVALIAVAAVALTLLFYRAKRAQLSRRSFIALTLLRALVIAATALFLMKPVLRFSRNRAEQSEVIILQDVSQSMGIHDAVEGRSRLDAGLFLLRQSPYRLLDKLSDTHKVRFFTFGGAATETQPSGAFQAEERTTALGDALKQSVAIVGQQSAAAVVLLTDGVPTSGEDPRNIARTLGVPVFPVALGGKMAEKGKFFDIGVAGVPHNLELIVHNAGKLKFTLSNVGLEGFSEAERAVTMTLRYKDEVVASAPVQFPAQDGSREVEMDYTPREVGVQKLAVSLPALPGEPITENNSREFIVRVTDPKIRVLIVEGVIRSEYRFLRKVLGSDPAIEVTSIIKKSKEEFYHQDADPGADLSRGLPRSKEDLKKFDVIILGDIARAEFTDEQLELLKEFVSGGAGLLAIGGYHAYGPGGYADSPVADLLPVKIRGPADGQSAGNFEPALTPVGRAHPVFEGCGKFFEESPNPAQPTMTGEKGPAAGATLDGANRIIGIKPGAEVLLVNPNETLPGGGEKMPVVAVQQFGAGRVLALTADTTWKWRFGMEGRGLDSPYYRFWRQSIRWVAGRKDQGGNRAKERLIAWPDKLEYAQGEPMSIEARVQAADGEPMDHAKVEVEIRNSTASVAPASKNAKGANGGAPAARAMLEPDPQAVGQYRGSVIPAAAGICRAVVTASDKHAEFARTEFEFSVGQIAGEFDRVDVDEVLLQTVAAESGGQFHTFATASQIPEELDRRQQRAMYREEKNIWNEWGFAAVFLACASAEWFLRKRNALH
jgi:uncharacterized membrane protein